MDVSIVKEFTVDLAAMITGNKHVEHMLAQGMETGNFFEKMGEKDGIWRCKDPMRWSMKQRLHKKRFPEQIRRLYYNAGQLGLAEVTVKYHCRETCRKLGVNGKAAAVNEARKRKLI